jgi:hypothetical protein
MKRVGTFIITAYIGFQAVVNSAAFLNSIPDTIVQISRATRAFDNLPDSVREKTLLSTFLIVAIMIIVKNKT